MRFEREKSQNPSNKQLAIGGEAFEKQSGEVRPAQRWWCPPHCPWGKGALTDPRVPLPLGLPPLLSPEVARVKVDRSVALVRHAIGDDLLAVTGGEEWERKGGRSGSSNRLGIGRGGKGAFRAALID